LFNKKCFCMRSNSGLGCLSLITSATFDAVANFGHSSGRVNFLWLWSGRVSHLWFGFEFGKFSLIRSKFSIFFPSGQKQISSGRVKGGLASYLLRVKSKLGLGRVGSGPISSKEQLPSQGSNPGTFQSSARFLT